MTLELSGVWTLLAALVTIELGKRMNRALPWIERESRMPWWVAMRSLLGSRASMSRR